VDPEPFAPARLWRDRIWPWLSALLLVLGTCCVVPGIGVTVWLYTQRCQPPADEATLIAAYTADPMIHTAVTTALARPLRVAHYCDPTTDAGPELYTAVSVLVPTDVWRNPDELAATYRATAAAAGWTYVGRNANYGKPGKDQEDPMVEFSRTINGKPATLIIMLGSLVPDDRDHRPFYEQRTIVSLPPGQATGWGPIATASPRAS
jgi:hypothetical protein